MSAQPPPLLPTCAGCGNNALVFDPAQQALFCPFCKTHGETLLGVQAGGHTELDLAQGLEELEQSLATETVRSVQCAGCGASLEINERQGIAPCPFCGNPLTDGHQQSQMSMRPQWMQPFRIPRDQAQKNVATWQKGLWFAPNAFKQLGVAGNSIAGVYLPFWTFDAKVHCCYTGQRGTKKQNVNKNNNRVEYSWTHCAGEVDATYDDIQVPASERIPAHLQSMHQGWDFSKLVAWDARFQAGFSTEMASVQIARAHALARSEMKEKLERSIQNDIGGDEQRIDSTDPVWSTERFRLALLPIWVMHCKYKGENHLVLVNGSTGEVAGERPYSWPKILALIVAIIVIFYFMFIR